MSKQKLFVLLALQLGLILLYSGYQRGRPSLFAQTIPTVTPPGPAATATSLPQPTATEGSGGTNPPPAATNTPQSGATVVPSPTSLLLAATPEGGFLPTALPCADSPTIQALNTLNVRQGPGLDYPIIDQLVVLEVRPITGRSQYEQWWLIELASGDSGWVADAPALAQGYIGNVPIVPAPPLDGQTATPGVPWQPTPLPFCTFTPTATATTTSSATPTATPTAALTATPTAVPPTSTVINNEADAATRIALSAVSVEITPTQLPTAYPPRPTATPLDIVTPASTPNFLPIAGFILIAGGIFIALARRKFSNP